MTEPVPGGRPDSALIVAASRARTQEILVAGLLHDLNGPLNNLRLTLELLGRVLAQAPTGFDDAANARVRRYLDTLSQESMRMSAWSHAAGTAISASGAGTGSEVLGALLVEAQRLFRHHAALAEVRLEAGAPGEPDVRVGDAAATRALLATLLCAAIALAPPGGVVRTEIAARDARVSLRTAITPAVVPSDAAGLFAVTHEMPRSALALDLASLRAQAELLQGEASLHVEADGARLDVTLPRAHPPS